MLSDGGGHGTLYSFQTAEVSSSSAAPSPAPTHEDVGVSVDMGAAEEKGEEGGEGEGAGEVRTMEGAESPQDAAMLTAHMQQVRATWLNPNP